MKSMSYRFAIVSFLGLLIGAVTEARADRQIERVRLGPVQYIGEGECLPQLNGKCYQRRISFTGTIDMNLNGITILSPAGKSYPAVLRAVEPSRSDSAFYKKFDPKKPVYRFFAEAYIIDTYLNVQNLGTLDFLFARADGKLVLLSEYEGKITLNGDKLEKSSN